MKIIGIDPGLSGGIAILEDNIIKVLFDMPVMSDGKKKQKTVEQRSFGKVDQR